MPKILHPLPPLGASALTPEVLAAMAAEERDFYNRLNQLATKEIVENKTAGRTPLFTPSLELRRLLQLAVDKGGLRYCQMRQLSGIFRIYY